MRSIASLLTIVLAAGASAVASKSTLDSNLCRPGETSAFSCAVARRLAPEIVPGTKRIALCGGAGQRLTYRVGTPKKLELEFPGKGVAAKDAFRFEEQNLQGSETARVLRFEHAGTSYEVFAQPDAAMGTLAGVVAAPRKGESVTLACSAAAPDALSIFSGFLPVPDATGSTSGRFTVSSVTYVGVGTWSKTETDALAKKPVVLGNYPEIAGETCDAPEESSAGSRLQATLRRCALRGGPRSESGSAWELRDAVAKCTGGALPRELRAVDIACARPFTIYALTEDRALAESEGAAFCLKRAR